MLSRDGILQAKDVKLEKVLAPEWAAEGQNPADAYFYVRVMTGAQRDFFDTNYQMLRADSQLRALMACSTICDERGQLLFAEEDIPLLAGKSAIVLDRVWDVGARLNCLTADSVAEAKKNLESTLTTDSGFSLPSLSDAA